MIGYFVRHPTAANLLMGVIILLGFLGYRSLTREVFPEFAPEFVNVQVIYRGASPEEVEETICRRIEEEIEGIEGIEKVTSTARESLALVVVEVADGYSIGAVQKDIENAVEQIDNFPEDTEEPLIWEVDLVDHACTVSIWADEMSIKDLAALAEVIESDLLGLDEVSLVKTYGISEHQIRIEVRQDQLLSRGLTIAEVSRTVAAQSVDLPSGSVETGQREIKIRVVDQRHTAEEFRELVVKVDPSGARIRLRDVATVTDTFVDEWTQTNFQGHRCINLEINKTKAEDTIRVADAAREYVEMRSKTLPSGVHIAVWNDWSYYVADRLWMLVENGMLGFILVFLTLWLFLHFRLAVWVAVGIPISFLGTLFLMAQADMSLNMITMFSLIMAVGIIVDDAIVIGENIYAHSLRGKSPTEAAIDGTSEVALGVVASMLTTVAIFMPLLTMEGEVGKLMRVMPIGVVTALSVSLVEGFFVLPNHLKHSLEKIPKEPSRWRVASDRLMQWLIHRLYAPVLEKAVQRPLIPVAGAVMLLLVSLGLLMGGRIRFELFPELDGDYLIAQVELPTGADLARTQAIATRMEEALTGPGSVNEHFRSKQPNQEDLILNISTSFGFVRTMGREPIQPETGSHIAQVIIELLGADKRNARSDDVLQEWRKRVGEVPNVVRLTFEQLQVTPGGKPIDIQLRGRDLTELKAASQQLQQQIKKSLGVRNVQDNLRPGKQEVFVRLKPVAMPLGITSAALASQLRQAFWGDIAQEFQRGSDNFEVLVLLAPGDRRSLADLDDFKVKTADGRMVPFHEVATARITRGYSQIIRVDGRRTVSVTADLDTRLGNATEILADLSKDFLPGFKKQYPNILVDLEGQSKERRKTDDSLKRGFVIGLCIIFILLSFVFQSYVEPLIVMAAIPFGLVGAIAGHWVLGLSWTMPSSVGFISLSGIVVNDSIILVRFIKLRLAEGRPVLEAVQEAGRQRFRPVFLTSATTVAGLLPMMLETSLQAQFLIPMAVSISFGLMFATVLVLLLVPCLYCILVWLGISQRITVKSFGKGVQNVP